MPLPNDRTGPVGSGPAPNTLAVGALGVDHILEQPSDTAANVRSFRPLTNEIARGTAGDCCMRCGKVAVDLPLDHGCIELANVGKFNATHARGFLDLVLGPIASGTISVSMVINNKSGLRSAHFPWIYQAVEQAEQWERRYKPHSIYFRVTALPPDGPKEGRGGTNDSWALNCMWADLDFGTVGHKPAPCGLPLPADEDEAKKLVDHMPTPTLWIHSGGGLYSFWIFEQPAYITTANRAVAVTKTEKWQKLISRRAEQLKLHYGNVGDLPRLLRLPGSINRKAGLERPCRAIEYSGELHQWLI